MDADEALEALLGDQRTGDLRTDLIEGLKEAMRRREHNAEHGGVVIATLVDMGCLTATSSTSLSCLNDSATLGDPTGAEADR